jgi:intraflagellar transport protein 140
MLFSFGNWSLSLKSCLVHLLANRCADSFLSAGHYDKAVHLYARAGQQQAALELILQQEVSLTEELAEALTPEKTEHNAEARTGTLLQLAQVWV